MHAGIALANLGDLIVKQNAEKRDFVVPTTRLELVAAGRDVPGLRFDLDGSSITADVTPHAMNQIAGWANIPRKYSDVLTSDPKHFELLEQNANHWLAQSDAKRMVRTFIGDQSVARAFLSDRYRPLDNYDLAHAIMPMLTSNGMEVKSASLTETRLYIQAVDMKLQAKIKPSVHQREVDDTVYAGIVISNSEVGSGSLSIEAMLYRLVCTNGLIAGDRFRRAHLGRALGGGDNDAVEMFSDNTKKLTDAALWAQVHDVVNASLSEATFQAVVAKFQAATTMEIPDFDPKRVVEVTAQRLNLSDYESDAVLKNLFTAGDPTIYGLTNAVTRVAQDVKSYDRAIELERLGSEVLTFDPQMFSKYLN